MISRKLLCTATLLCLAPFAATAAEAHLTPSSNGGSGAMPSGYTKLFFETSDNDFAGELKLPGNPRDLDRVVLTSMAGARASRLDAAGTSVADLVYVPVEPLSNFVIGRSNFNSVNAPSRWIATGAGLNETRLILNKGTHGQAPAIEKSFVDLHVAGAVSTVGLPPLAPRGAVLGLVNYTQHDVTIKGPELAGQAQTCAAAQSCAFVFDAADGRWHARRGRAHFQPTTEQLPKLDQRWTDIVISGPAEDVTTPTFIKLPLEAVEGDIVQLADLSNSRIYHVRSNPDSGASVLSSAPSTYRYNSGNGRWEYQR